MPDQDFEIIGKTIHGMEGVLESELKELGIKNVLPLTRGALFRGTLADLYRVNYCCRSAVRFLKPIFKFNIKNEQDLYRKVKDFRWEEVFSLTDTFAIDAVVNNFVITHSKYAALKTKDAIVDRFRERSGKRPSVDIENPTIRFHLHIYQGECSISIDSSGSSLHMRGYRIKTVAAPINEVLAAGLILLTGWDGQTNFIDPMCGSGTFLIEAAMIAKSIPAGYFRQYYGFQKWKDYDKDLWKAIKEEANSRIHDFNIKILGSDKSDRAIRTTRANLQNARLHQEIELMNTPIEESSPPVGKGIVIVNPPYGERMIPDDIIALYKTIGDSFKRSYAGYNAWVISSDLGALKFVGLRPSKKITVFNGKLECRFARFELYEGSKKAKKQNHKKD